MVKSRINERKSILRTLMNWSLRVIFVAKVRIDATKSGTIRAYIIVQASIGRKVHHGLYALHKWQLYFKRSLLCFLTAYNLFDGPLYHLNWNTFGKVRLGMHCMWGGENRSRPDEHQSRIPITGANTGFHSGGCKILKREKIFKKRKFLYRSRK